MIHLGQLNPAALTPESFDLLTQTYRAFVEDIFGLLEEKPQNLENIVDLALEDYREAKAAKNYAKVDDIRAKFKAMGLAIKDMKDRIEWAYEE